MLSVYLCIYPVRHSRHMQSQICSLLHAIIEELINNKNRSTQVSILEYSPSLFRAPRGDYKCQNELHLLIQRNVCVWRMFLFLLISLKSRLEDKMRSHISESRFITDSPLGLESIKTGLFKLQYMSLRGDWFVWNC